MEVLIFVAHFDVKNQLVSLKTGSFSTENLV